jgi:uncharacterized protein involved in tellurium resistance
MKPRQVDLVLVVDASHSMRPCFDQLKTHLQNLLLPLNQANFKVRIGLVAYAAAAGRRHPVYDHVFIGGSGPMMLAKLYSHRPDEGDFFTENPAAIVRALNELSAQGNENTLLALDVAADLPFAPVASTRRVIALFSDERLEDGVTGEEPVDKIPQLLEKLMNRRIQLFVAAPSSPALDMLGSLDQAEIHTVDGGDGLKGIDFRKLLAQMAKSISVSSLQSAVEPNWQKALFGQDRWGPERGITATERRVVLAVGEVAQLSMAAPLRNVNVKMKWSAPVDLDLHAFVKTSDGLEHHVFFADMSIRGLRLDYDAGVGDRGGRNQENITISDPDSIRSVLFATKIFSKGGCYADYDGRVIVTTNNGDEVEVPLTSQESADWCVIAKLVNDGQGAAITNINRVCRRNPQIDDF